MFNVPRFQKTVLAALKSRDQQNEKKLILFYIFHKRIITIYLKPTVLQKKLNSTQFA